MVYYGLLEGLYGYYVTAVLYLAFLVRISPAKRVDRVIEIAKASGMAIKSATKVDAATGPTARTSWLSG
jgi:hypothetical protein